MQVGRTTLAALSFLIYTIAVLVQAQSYASHWAAEHISALPGAVSYAAHGVPLGTIDTKIHYMFLNSERDQIASGTIARAAQPGTVSGQTDIAKDGTGIGYILFTSLAMKLFGISILSLPIGLLVLMGVSTAAFIVRFQDDRLAIVSVAYTALTVLLLTPLTTDQHFLDQGPVAGYRYMSVLAILPAIHLIYELMDSGASDHKHKLINYAMLGVQAALLSSAFMIRSSVGYLALAVGVAALIVLWRCWDNRGRIVKLVKDLGLSAAVAIAVLGAMVAAVPSEYVTSGRAAGNIWHRVFISLSLRPAWPYGNLREMFPCTNAYPNGLSGRFDQAGWCAWYAAHPEKRPTLEEIAQDARHTFYDAEYESVMRDAFFKVARAYPLHVAETFLIHKSGWIIWTLGVALNINWQALTPALIWMAALQVSLLAAFAMVVGKDLFPGKVFLALFPLSLLPAYAVYSVLETSIDTVAYMFALFALGFIVLVRYARHQLTRLILGPKC